MKKYITKNLHTLIKNDAKKIKKFSTLNLTLIQNLLSEMFGYRHYHELIKELENYKTNPDKFILLEDMSFSDRLLLKENIPASLRKILKNAPANFILESSSFFKIPHLMTIHTQTCGEITKVLDFRKNNYNFQFTDIELKKYLLIYLNNIKNTPKLQVTTGGERIVNTIVYHSCYSLLSFVFDFLKANGKNFSLKLFNEYTDIKFLFDLMAKTEDLVLKDNLNQYFNSITNFDFTKENELNKKYSYHYNVLEVIQEMLNNNFIFNKHKEKINISSLLNNNIKLIYHLNTPSNEYNIKTLIYLLKG